MPGRIYVLATHIYRIIATGFTPDYGMAAAVGMSALATSIALIYLYRYLTSESEKFVTVSSRGYRPTLIDLKNARYPLFGIVGMISFVLIVLPVLVLFYTSLVPYSMVPSARAFSLMSWKNWTAVLVDPISLLSVKNSIFFSRASIISSSLFPTPAKTIFCGLTPALTARYNSPPETISTPAPKEFTSRIILILEQDFTE